MTGNIDVGGRRHQVRVHRAGGGLRVVVDGAEWMVDAARIDGQTLSLLVRGVSAAGSLAPRRSDAQLRSADVPAGGRTHSVEVILTAEAGSGRLSVQVRGVPVSVLLDNGRRAARGAGANTSAGVQRIIAPMPGRIVRVPVSRGDRVRARQTVAVVEAMKMENELRAAEEGTVSDVPVREGQLVEAGALLAVIEP